MAEKEGKPVELLVVPAVDPFDAMVQTAAKLKASRLVTGVSARMESEELARRNRPRVGEAAGAAACVFARDDQPGPAVDLTSTSVRIRRGCGRRMSTGCTSSG